MVRIKSNLFHAIMTCLQKMSRANQIEREKNNFCSYHDLDYEKICKHSRHFSRSSTLIQFSLTLNSLSIRLISGHWKEFDIFFPVNLVSSIVIWFSLHSFTDNTPMREKRKKWMVGSQKLIRFATHIVLWIESAPRQQPPRRKNAT